MATWIGHLRIAQQVLPLLPEIDAPMFYFGSLAPDSGEPNDDWSKFDPPKEVTHFLDPGDPEDKIHDLQFYYGFLAICSSELEPERYSFLLGYFFHLLSDNLWSRRINRAYKANYQDTFAEKGPTFWWELKRDWYDLDRLYLRENPQSLFWQVLSPTHYPPVYVPFVDEAVANRQIDYIRNFYSKQEDDCVLDRPYPHMNETTMSRYIEDTASALISIHRLLQQRPDLNGEHSALSLLPQEALAPYPMPLGG